MRYVTANQIQPQTDDLFKKGLDPGTPIGFKSLLPHWNAKRGCTTYIGGIPSHGKTEWHLEALMSLSEHFGWKHALFSPESGSPVEVIAELSHKYIGKSFNKGAFQMSEADKYKADAFLSGHFFLLTPDENKLTVDELLDIASEIKKTHGLDSFSIDPFNELNHDFSKFGGREDKYLENVLGKIRRFARAENVHVFIIAHPRTLKPQDGKYLPPTAFELSGGAAWYAKAESILCVHRPDMTSNRVEIHIQKAKPKQIGRKGSVILNWDWKKSRYYEESPLSSERTYSHHIDMTAAKKAEEDTEMPF